MSDEPTTGSGPADIITSVGPQSLADAGRRRSVFARFTLAKRAIKKAERRINRKLLGIEDQIVEDYLELDTDSMRVEHRGVKHSLYLSPELWLRPLKTGVDEQSGEPASTDEDWAKAVAMLRQIGAGDLVQERFNVQSASAWLRRVRDANGVEWKDALPAEFFEALDIEDKTRVKMRKAGK